MQPRRRNDLRPFQPGDLVDVLISKGWNPRGGSMRANIVADLSSQNGRGMFLVRYESGLSDTVHQQRFTLIEAVEDRG